MKTTVLTFLVCSFFSAYAGAAMKAPVKPEKLKFRYIQIEGTEEVDCAHTHISNYDWEVTCKGEKKTYKYGVHLALTYYPHTNEGYPAYELLYWVSDSKTGAGDSISQWTYLSSEVARIKKLQTRVGIENDLSYLQLSINLE